MNSFQIFEQLFFAFNIILTLSPYYISQDLQRSKSKEIEVFRTVKMKEKKK